MIDSVEKLKKNCLVITRKKMSDQDKKKHTLCSLTFAE